MAVVRYVTCGRMAMYLPGGAANTCDILRLYNYPKGAVIVSQQWKAERNVSIEPDNQLLKEALKAIEELIASDTDFPCKNRPFINEIYMDDGTYRYAPYDELRAILENLMKTVDDRELKLPNPAGAFAMDTNIPVAINERSTNMSEIKEIRYDVEGVKYRMKIDGDSARLDEVYVTYDMTSFSFSASHEALQEALAKFVPEIMSDYKNSEKPHYVTLSDGEKKNVEIVALDKILMELVSKLGDDKENVKVEYKNSPVKLAGAIAYDPMKEKMNGFSGMMQFMNQNTVTEAPKPVPSACSRLYVDGTWDCACGAKGLTGKFCYDCGAAKPEKWICDCGAENAGRFCAECGKPRPQSD